MANHLSAEKKLEVLERFLEGQTYRRIQKLTGVHTTTIAGLLRQCGAVARQHQQRLPSRLHQVRTVDVVRHDVVVNKTGYVVLVAMWRDVLLAHSLGKTSEDAVLGLAAKLPYVRTIRSNCAAVRSAVSSSMSVGATGFSTGQSEVWRTPFPDQYRYQPGTHQPMTLELLDAAVHLFAVYCNFIKPAAAVGHALYAKQLRLSDLIDYGGIPWCADHIKEVDYNEAMALVPHCDTGIDHPYWSAIYWLGHNIEMHLEWVAQMRAWRKIDPWCFDEEMYHWYLESAWDLYDAQVELYRAGLREQEAKPDDQETHPNRSSATTQDPSPGC